MKMFSNSIVPLPSSGVTPTGMIVNAVAPVHVSDVMPLHFHLALPKALNDELESRVEKGEIISQEELSKKYVVDQSSVDALTNWLRNEGFQIDHVTPDRSGVYTHATVDQIQKSLGVHMVRVTTDGMTVTAASDVPSLPESVAEAVEHIGGLQPFVRAHKHLRRQPLNRGRTFIEPPVVDDGYLVGKILTAYGADDLNITGQGQEIAILIDTFALDDDVREFWARNGINNNLANIVKINVGGGSLPSIEGEESLDTEWASGIAPGAQVRVYASGGLDFTALDRALDRIIEDVAERPGLRQVSISLGLGELYLHGPSGEIAAQRQKYLRLAAAGVNIFVSSGDAGSNPGPTGHLSNGPLQPEYAAADPSVVAVGGTSLVLDDTGRVLSETGWAGSGGGKSHYFPRPSWQRNRSIPSGAQRLVPDVSLAADPAHGALVIVNGAPISGGVGGTSWSAPVWAGFCALMNEARQRAGKPRLPFLNPLLYPLTDTNSKAFRDITSGSNGAYSAAAGFDLVTGLGVPNLADLLAALP